MHFNKTIAQTKKNYQYYNNNRFIYLDTITLGNQIFLKRLYNLVNIIED